MVALKNSRDGQFVCFQAEFSTGRPIITTGETLLHHLGMTAIMNSFNVLTRAGVHVTGAVYQ